MLDPYKSAKLEKLKQLKKIMYELMAEEGLDPDEPMAEASLGEAMEEAEEAVSGEEETEEAPEQMDELTKMKKDYFTPKVRERRPGTAVLFEQITAGPVKPDMKKAMGKKGYK